MILEHDQNPMATSEQKVSTLQDSVQRALEDLQNRIWGTKPVIINEGPDLKPISDRLTDVEKKASENKSGIDGLDTRLAAEEKKVQPVSLGGTGKTTAEAGLLALGGIKIEELWTNQSSKSGFPEQNIKVDLSDCTHIIVEARVFNTFTVRGNFPFRVYPAQDDWYVGLINFAYAYGGKMRNYYREVRTPNNEVRFNNGYYATPTSDTASENCCIPTRIYGIKGVL